ncbi:MAG: hypothetical protein CM15mV86_490 [uncultured marine virus]|jgi:hypothetical protein|nr:MAG: hypothetical protein CM15mV86_490 [uncultured marine virus]|tara:strand:+ start:505 stop:687 length:183 start_codon:yes stop_codon:yes gene_type:complete
MTEQTEFLYYRDLFDIFKVYQVPKLLRILDEQGINYFKSADGKPFTTRAAINGALEKSAG